MKVAIYARYSSDSQREASIEDQIRLCRERAEREGWTIITAYTDHAVSGASLLRPGIQSLLSDAAQRKFNVILAEALDRLSRDQEDTAGVYKRMAFAGVKIITLSEGEVSNLHVGLKGTMNALFLQDLADKTRRGLRGRVEAGKSGGGNSYGYRVVRRLDATGDPITGEREIVEAEASTIRRIFREFSAGKSPRALAKQLNAENILGPGGRPWMDTAIRGSAKRGNGILNNELYIGKLVWNRQRFIKDPDTGNRVSRANPPEAWITQDVPELRIVEDELWDKAKARQKTMTAAYPGQKGKEFWDKRRPRYLFSGLLTCGICGGGFSMISKTHLGCSTARNKGTCDNRLMRSREALEAEVLDGLKSRLMQPELFDIFCTEWTKHLNAIQMAKSERLAALRTELARCKKALDQIADAIVNGVPASAVKEKAIKLQNRREHIEAELARTREPVMLMHPNMAHEYRRKVRGLTEALNKPEGRAEAADLIRSLIEKIVLVPEDSKLHIEIVGDLAGILSLAANQKPCQRPATNTSEIEQLKVVAGVRS
ncbi:MAG: recombinase family protein [Chitinophagales bacterium]|nr:recombinase family protein [Hyphomicrobiales bacterium]